MTQRLLIGYHPGFAQVGMWISKPGIDVLATTTEANFLFSSTRKVHQIVMSGRVHLFDPTATTVDVFFPLTFSSKRPYVFFNASQTSSGIGQYPHDLNYGGDVGAKDAGISLTVRTDRFQIGMIAGNIRDVYVDYIVFNTQIN